MVIMIIIIQTERDARSAVQRWEGGSVFSRLTLSFVTK